MILFPSGLVSDRFGRFVGRYQSILGARKRKKSGLLERHNNYNRRPASTGSSAAAYIPWYSQPSLACTSTLSAKLACLRWGVAPFQDHVSWYCPIHKEFAMQHIMSLCCLSSCALKDLPQYIFIEWL